MRKTPGFSVSTCTFIPSQLNKRFSSKRLVPVWEQPQVTSPYCQSVKIARFDDFSIRMDNEFYVHSQVDILTVEQEPEEVYDPEILSDEFCSGSDGSGNKENVNFDVEYLQYGGVEAIFPPVSNAKAQRVT